MIACAALLLSATTFAQTDSTKMRSENEMQKENKMKKDCVMMKDGVMMQMKDGKATAMSSSVTMSNGTVVMPDGTVTKQDGSKMTLKEGDSMDMKGNLKMMDSNQDHKVK